MTDAVMQADESSKAINASRLRLWPAIMIVTAMWLARVWATVGEMAPSKFFFGLVIAPVTALLLLQLWWLFGSRLRWSDRLLGFGTFVATAAATVTLAGNNFPAMPLIMYALPVVTTLWVAWLILTVNLSWPLRRAGVLMIFLATGVYYSLLRVDGMDGSFAAKFNWRWTPTSEAKLMSELKSLSKPSVSSDAPAVADLTLSGGGLAWLSWSATRWPLDRLSFRHGLGQVTAEGALASSDWPRLVVMRGHRQPLVYARTAWSRRIRRLL